MRLVLVMESRVTSAFGAVLRSMACQGEPTADTGCDHATAEGDHGDMAFPNGISKAKK